MTNTQESRNTRLKSMLISYAVYISLFIGTGFLSGAIVHFPINPTRYAIIGFLGALIFTIASTVNEALFNKRTFKDEGVFKVILFSLLLSIGVGMISGGVQHFDEFPVYGSYLVPLGILLSMVAYIFKSDIHLLQKQVVKLTLATLLVVVPLGLGLNIYARTIDVESHHTIVKKTNSMLHAVMIRNDQDFLSNMIPHHEEAVASSQYVLARTTDPELKQFLQTVIDSQSKEIEQMEKWHEEWLSTKFSTNSSYVPMMSNLLDYSGTELERKYVQGMIEHHDSAIQMAKDILPITTRSEVKSIANEIISVQGKEVKMLNDWLRSKYGETSESDGHAGGH